MKYGKGLFDEETLREVMEQIISGRIIIQHNNKFYALKYPNEKHKRIAEVKYKQYYKEALESGIPTNIEMEKYLREQNIISDEKEKQTEDLRKEISKHIDKIFKIKSEAAYKVIKENLDKLRLKLYELEHEKQKYFVNTAESKAEEMKLLYLISRCAENIDEENSLLWETYEDFINEVENDLLNKFLTEFRTIFYGINTRILRYIARGGGDTGRLWRAKWTISKKTPSPLFPGEITDWDINKVLLCYWTNFYDSVYEAYERPPQYVIEDDELLDKWVEKTTAKYEKEATKKYKGIGELKSLEHSTVILFDDYFDEHPEELLGFEEKHLDDEEYSEEDSNEEEDDTS